MIGWMLQYEGVLPEHFSEGWSAELQYNREKPDDPFKPYGTTPGHSIEWARLILQWALSDPTVGDRDYNAYQNAALTLYARAMENAWSVDGSPGFCYTVDWERKPVIHDRMHWVLAEAINTSSLLYRITDNPMFAEDYHSFMEYLDVYVADHEQGSWYHQLDRDNKVIATVWPGKPDLYHAVQAMIYPYLQFPEKSFAAAL